jgi:hypothetical protein
VAHLLAPIGVQTYPGKTSFPNPLLRIDVDGLVDVVESNHRTSRIHREPTRAVVFGRLPNLASHLLAWLGFDARRRQPVGKSLSRNVPRACPFQPGRSQVASGMMLTLLAEAFLSIRRSSRLGYLEGS